MFSWTVVQAEGFPPSLGAVGVSSDRDRAVGELEAALRCSPEGSYGLLHRVKRRLDARGYWYELLLGRARIAPGGGALVMDEPGVAGGRSGDVFAAIEQAGQEAW